MASLCANPAGVEELTIVLKLDITYRRPLLVIVVDDCHLRPRLDVRDIAVLVGMLWVLERLLKGVLVVHNLGGDVGCIVPVDSATMKLGSVCTKVSSSDS